MLSCVARNTYGCRSPVREESSGVRKAVRKAVEGYAEEKDRARTSVFLRED